MVTTVLCGLCGVVLYIYGNDEYLTGSEPRWFSTLITALPIGVGLSVSSSLRSYVQMLRWRILASRYWSLRQFDMILRLSEQTSVLQLLWHSRRKRYWILPTWTQMLCAAWLALNLAGAVVIALLGLTYSTIPGTVARTTSGNVSVLDLSYTYTFESLNDVMVGDGELTSNFVPENQIERQNFVGLHSDRKLCVGDCTTWFYTFQDQSVVNSSITSSSGRMLSSSATCSGYNISIVQENSVMYVGQNGKNVTFEFDGINSTWTRPPLNGMTYLYRTDPTGPSCGKRCALIYGFQAQYYDTPARFYECTNTVSTVALPPAEASESPILQLSAANARITAAAIAFGTVPPLSWEVYPALSPWLPTNPVSYSTQDSMDSAVANAISQFSMTAMAASDQDTINETAEEEIAKRAFVQGMRPYLPSQLTVSWIYAGAILIGIPLLQLISLLAVILYANKAIVKDNSHFSTAKLLAPMVQQMGDHGCLLTGDEIVQVLGGNKMRVRYGSDHRATVEHVGVFSEKGAGSVARSSFQEGLYDGRDSVLC